MSTITVPLWLFIIVCIPTGIAAILIVFSILIFMYGVMVKIYQYFRDEIRGRAAVKRAVVEEHTDND